uniref:hypothetical protein n=1 Tax=Faecalibacterium prausnitzii TaxID=853 RepID=UPI00402A2B5D
PALFRSLERRPLSNLSVSLPLDSSPEKGSPWQRGFVFDETDLRLLENVTECQSLPLSGEVASSEAKMSERLYRAAPALFRSL